MKNAMKYLPSISALLNLCALFSFAALASALVAQYGFNLHPCPLCIYQRIPYAIIAVIGVFAYFLRGKNGKYYLAVACAALFFADAGIAVYHTGVEYGWFPAPTTCSSSGGIGQTLEEMRAAIMGAPLVTCAQAMAYIFGLSMAAWNALAAAAAFVATSFVLWKRRGE